MEHELEQTPVENAGDAEKPEVEPSREALVKKWLDKVKKAEKYWETKVFKQMRENIEFAAAGAEKDWLESGKYVVPILSRHINQSVSALYAKNPEVTVKRKHKLNYILWDGRSDSLNAAMEMATLGDKAAIKLIEEIISVRQHEQMLDKMGKTLEILFEYYIEEQSANYKQQLKAAVRRAKTCKVAYIKLGYQRIMEPNPEIVAKIDDVTSKIASVQGMLSDVAHERLDDDAPDMETLRLSLQDLQKQEMMVVREGPVLDFPLAWEWIVDPACRHLKSFVGARWCAHKFHTMTPRKIKEIYDVDISAAYTSYSEKGRVWSESEKDSQIDDERHALVYEIWDKENQQCLTVCDGYPDFLKEPASPDVYLERFWPVFAIVFNEAEGYIYPRSDIEHAMHIQNEYNRSRESLRQHRIAARPYYIHDGRVSEEEMKRLSSHADHEVFELPSLGTGEKVEDLLQRGPTAPIDPNLYDTEIHFKDLQRVVGAQAANLGGTAGDTATESSIAEASKNLSESDQVDDLDEVLTEMARSMGQLMLMELPKETVMEIVGPGAVWPDLSVTREEAAKELQLEIKAGSSGKPNRAVELANMERGMPFLLQLPAVNPEPVARKYVELLELGPMDEVIAAGVPSITAINAMMAKAAAQPATGDPATDPASQGGQGAQNAQGPQQNEIPPGPQPGFPAPAPVG